MTLQTCMITLAGQEILGAYDSTDYYIAVRELEKALGWKADSTREKASRF